MMTDRQRKVLVDAFLLLAAGARTGKQKAYTGTAEEVLKHVVEVEAMVAELRKGLEGHVGAGAVLERARAKPLSSSHREPVRFQGRGPNGLGDDGRGGGR